jgi:hypothetical protein
MIETYFSILRDIPDLINELISVLPCDLNTTRARFSDMFLIQVATVTKGFAVILDNPAEIVLETVLVIIMTVSGCLSWPAASFTDRVTLDIGFPGPDVLGSSPPARHLIIVVPDRFV